MVCAQLHVLNTLAARLTGLQTPKVDIHRRISTQLTRFMAKQRWRVSSANSTAQYIERCSPCLYAASHQRDHCRSSDVSFGRCFKRSLGFEGGTVIE
jgi:hypothetical protein